jgi:hypothetical protein
MEPKLFFALHRPNDCWRSQIPAVNGNGIGDCELRTLAADSILRSKFVRLEFKGEKTGRPLYDLAQCKVFHYEISYQKKNFIQNLVFFFLTSGKFPLQYPRSILEREVFEKIPCTVEGASQLGKGVTTDARSQEKSGTKTKEEGCQEKGSQEEDREEGGEEAAREEARCEEADREEGREEAAREEAEEEVGQPKGQLAFRTSGSSSRRGEDDTSGRQQRWKFGNFDERPSMHRISFGRQTVTRR